jgi:hypothetical protein
MNTTKGSPYGTNKKSTDILEDVKINVKMKLSALWIALMLLYIYADILSLFRPGQIEEMIEGRMGPLPATQISLLTASILMIIPAVMVFLSLTLKPALNRWTNIALGTLYTLVNSSNLIGEPWAYYISFGIVEIVLTLLIVWYSWKWPAPQVRSDHMVLNQVEFGGNS